MTSGVGGSREQVGREQVVSDLYREMHSELLAFARGQGMSPHDAEDIISDTFASLLSLSDERFHAILKLRPYAFQVARHLIYRRGRAAGKVTPVPDDRLDTTDEPRDAAVAGEMAGLVRRAFLDLDDGQRSILWMSMIEGLSSKTIAARLGTTVTNVTTRVSRARAALHQSYTATYIEQQPPECGTQPALLAREVTQSLTPRQQAVLREHVDGCPHCTAVLLRAREEMTSPVFSAVAPAVMLLMAMRVGVVQVGAGSTLATTVAVTHATSTVKVGVVATAVVLAVVAFATVGLVLDNAHVGGQRRDGGGRAAADRPSRVDITSAVDIDASPRSATIRMPAPGGSDGWSMTATNHGSSSTPLSVVVIDRRAPGAVEEPLLQLWHGADPLTVAQPVSGYDQALLYVGLLAPGQSYDLRGAVSRLRSDVDQRLTGALTVRFIAGVEVPRGTRPGDLVPIDPDAGRGGVSGFLPSTGLQAGLPWVLLAGVASICTGVMLVRRSRRLGVVRGGRRRG